MNDSNKLVDSYIQYDNVKYNYTEAILNAVERFLKEKPDYIINQLKKYNNNVYLVVDNLRDEDFITGNSYGSYTFNKLEAKAYVLSIINEVPDIFKKADFNAKQLVKLISEDDWETIDVIIRCAKFDEVYQDIIDMIKDNFIKNNQV